MITRNDIIDALTKCSGYDSAHTPQPSEIVVLAWMEHFGDFPTLTRDDLLQAVKEYHREIHDVQLQPAHLSKIARKYSRERFERSELDSPERLRLEAVADSKAAPELAVEAADSAAGGELPSGALSGSQKELQAATEAARRPEDRRAIIEQFAKTIKKSPKDVEDRYLVQLAQHHREHGKPVLPPCPNCGSVDPCEHDQEENEDG